MAWRNRGIPTKKWAKAVLKPSRAETRPPKVFSGSTHPVLPPETHIPSLLGQFSVPVDFLRRHPVVLASPSSGAFFSYLHFTSTASCSEFLVLFCKDSDIAVHCLASMASGTLAQTSLIPHPCIILACKTSTI